MERSITVLRMEEPARFNPERLERLCAEIGEHRAEHEVALALEAIGKHLKQITLAAKYGDGAGIMRPLNALVDASDLIGMATLAGVGKDVQGCLDRDDAVALAATLARLCRIGERSLHALWDLEDLSG